jgi:GNAT superfamily N-acetyltransferase
MVAVIATNEVPDSTRTYTYNPVVAGWPAFVLINWPEKREDPVGWAFIIGDDDKGCLLADIWVEPSMRRMGIGRDIVRVLQSRYRRIWTGLSTPEGRELCLSMGFEIKRGIHKRDIPKLEWEAPHAGSNGKRTEKGS